MPITCTFELNKPDGFYSSGETITGTVILQLAIQEHVKDIHLVLRGEAKVSWEVERDKTRRNGTKYSETVVYSANEIYIDRREVLAGEGSIGPGQLTYPFSLLLPEHCRSSFKGTYGSIRYNLSLVLERGGWANDVFHKPLIVTKVDNLNLNPICRIPLQAEETKGFCCSNGTLSYTLTIPYGAYVSQQVLEYSLHIQNQSLSDTDGYTISIMQESSYTAQIPEHDENDESHEMYSKTYPDSCLRLSTRIFKGDVIIPRLVPTMDGDGIIRMHYELSVTVHFSGCTPDSVIRVPLRIGTIALTDISPTAPILPLSEKGGPPNYQYFKPPSFDEATVSSAPPEEAPPYEIAVGDSQRPFMGFRILNEKEQS